jgi:ERCC4-related helicase
LFCILQVLKHLAKENRVIRIVGLSATPGTNIDAVTEVIQNLNISRLEFRTDESPDVAKYTNKKDVECIPVKLTNTILEIRNQFLKVCVVTHLIIILLFTHKNMLLLACFFFFYKNRHH